MIQRFSFGHPFPTQSVVLSLPAESGPVPFLTPDGSGWQLTLSEQAAVYGLGEMPRGINKRGWHYITNNTDESRHSEDKLSFYGAHNFLLVRDGSTCFGLFVDFPGKVYYDIGYTRHDLFSFHTETPDYDLYLLSGGNENAICKEFRTPHRPQLHPAPVGIRSGTEPLGLQDRGGRAGGCTPVQGARPAAGYDLHGH